MDSTYVKDFLSYTMFRKAGADAPLCSYAWIKVNGENHGLYLAVEDIEESFLERTGRAGGVLYKPDSDKLDADIDLNEVVWGDYSEGSELSYRGEAVHSGVFKEETAAVYEMLLPRVEKDPTAFFTPEEYSASFRNLQDYCLLRAESYRRQLDGRLSMETDSQLPADRVDPGDLTFAGLT